MTPTAPATGTTAVTTAQKQVVAKVIANGKPVINTSANPKPFDASLPLVQHMGVNLQPTADGSMWQHVTPPSSGQNRGKAAGNQQSDIVVTRSNTHFGTLGYAFGADDEIGNSYASVIAQINGAQQGLTCTVTYLADGSMQFDYTDGTNHDYLKVQWNQANMYNFNKKCERKIFKASDILANWSDTNTEGSAFTVSIGTFVRSDNGGLHPEPASWIANQTENQYLAYKVRLGLNAEFDRTQGFFGAIIALNGGQMTHSLLINSITPIN